MLHRIYLLDDGTLSGWQREATTGGNDQRSL